jgi:hypothetical protein
MSENNTDDSISRKEILRTVLAVLNEAHLDDASAIQQLCDNRVPCNTRLAGHQTIQVVAHDPFRSESHYSVGMLGIINGIVERLTGERIAALLSKHADEYNKILGFVAYKKS